MEEPIRSSNNEADAGGGLSPTMMMMTTTTTTSSNHSSSSNNNNNNNNNAIALKRRSGRNSVFLVQPDENVGKTTTTTTTTTMTSLSSSTTLEQHQEMIEESSSYNHIVLTCYESTIGTGIVTFRSGMMFWKTREPPTFDEFPMRSPMNPLKNRNMDAGNNNNNNNNNSANAHPNTRQRLSLSRCFSQEYNDDAKEWILRFQFLPTDDVLFMEKEKKCRLTLRKDVVIYLASSMPDDLAELMKSAQTCIASAKMLNNNNHSRVMMQKKDGENASPSNRNVPKQSFISGGGKGGSSSSRPPLMRRQSLSTLMTQQQQQQQTPIISISTSNVLTTKITTNSPYKSQLFHVRDEDEELRKLIREYTSSQDDQDHDISTRIQSEYGYHLQPHVNFSEQAIRSSINVKTQSRTREEIAKEIQPILRCLKEGDEKQKADLETGTKTRCIIKDGIFIYQDTETGDEIEPNEYEKRYRQYLGLQSSSSSHLMKVENLEKIQEKFGSLEQVKAKFAQRIQDEERTLYQRFDQALGDFLRKKREIQQELEDIEKAFLSSSNSTASSLSSSLAKIQPRSKRTSMDTTQVFADSVNKEGRVRRTSLDMNPLERDDYSNVSTSTNTKNSSCPICLEVLKNNEPSQIVVLQPCNHVVCSECFSRWKENLIQENKSMTCVLCRNNILII